ncbi:MAG: ACP S-malonyltransferase [Melioribacteraceae bacterium]|nr:ACP S-malonyltransferase [Melioribacteraceae bacterium]
MSKRAFIFPGQGSQYVGMAKDFYDKDSDSKKIIDFADEILGFKLSETMFFGPEDNLKETSITQPAIFLHSIVALQKLNLNFDMVAGHSLGEYSALVAADAIDFEEALRLVRKRGEAMYQAGIEKPGTMAAIIGLDVEKINDCCAEASMEGIVQCANLNSPGQVVISGTVEGVKKAMFLCKEAGAKLTKELIVSGAFHSPLMESAEEKLQITLETVEIRDAQKPVYTNVTASPTINSIEIKNFLIDQLTFPVRWEEIISNMIDDGAEEFIEIGPGKVLQGLVKRINPDVKITGIDKYEDLERL